ncbi:carboxypeptidase [Haloferula helveola]|uniref:Carboxypeptidase n=1 Tax=Haloferula helveola TaxID=490095 RepID=A0ABN6HEU7_9BACT|nr:carboxypeptidase [Haloferula helveola]
MRTLTLLLITSLAVFGQDKPEKPAKKDTPAEKDKKEAVAEPVTREGTVQIDGTKVDYEVTTAKLQIKKDDGTPRAAVFHVSYIRKGTEDPSKRPVMFAFNGGPGSSAVWLHLGMLGPYRVDLPGDGVDAPKPPARLISNPYSILDVTDLVFVDPVSTGYSRAEKDTKPSEFHGVREDVESIGDFVRRWVTENDRWSSPKYLLGESYGGIRVAGLSEHLQSRYGMTLNGVVLLSSLLDFRTLRPADGDALMYSVYLPTFAAVAHYHGKLKGERDDLIKQADEFAFGDYALALLKGNAISSEEKQKVAKRLSELTSLDTQLLLDLDLRLDPSRFRAELLRSEGKTVGRFDARVAWPSESAADDYPSYDPSFSLAFGAYSTAMLSYLSEELGWEEEAPYEILTGKVHPWNWSANNSVVNLSGNLAKAMRDNPYLKVLVMEGACDLATPPAGIQYSIRQMTELPESGLKRIERTEYDAGHMFYLNPPDLKKSRTDLVDFITAAP